jgi:hypothetical protein
LEAIRLPVTNWNETVINGKNYLVIEVAQLRIPLDWDPNSNVFIAVAAPAGGELNYPALVQGDPGETPDIDNVIDFTPLDPDDPTPDFASWTETSPNVYQLSLGLHTGQTGADGVMVLDPDTFGTPVAKDILVVNSGLTGFELQRQKIADPKTPATITAVPSGNPAYTKAIVHYDALGFPWRPRCEGSSIITSTGPDLVVDLVARLGRTGDINPETAGNVIAIGAGVSGSYPANQTLIPAQLTGEGNTYDLVPADSPADIYFRAERRSGADTFTTSGTWPLSTFRVWPEAAT